MILINSNNNTVILINFNNSSNINLLIRKCLKHAKLSVACEFQPVAIKTHGPFSDTTTLCLVDLGPKISEHSGEPLEDFIPMNQCLNSLF